MFAAPYLNAIQKIPGDTAGEKMKWIGKLSQNRQKASGDIDQLSPELQPILRVETAVRKKIHEDVAAALKSDDVTIIRRALQASWFFDGSHKNVVDVEYFCKQIFPHVSVNTRLHIIKTLTLRLKDPQFAQQLFTEVTSMYGLQQALPLLVVCDEEFAYQTIVKRKIKLTFAIAKKFFRRNADFIVRYLRLSDPLINASFRVNIQDYISFLPLLVKKRLAAFVELYEMHESNLPSLKLSNTCTDAFLKNGMEHLLRKPLLYIKILPLEKISAAQMEMIFPGLLPEKVRFFDMNTTMRYLSHYPENKKLDLISAAYRNKYNIDLLSTLENVTPDILKLMPAEQRSVYARMKMEREKLRDEDQDSMLYETSWTCYLSTDNSIPFLKNSIKTATTPENRLGLMWQIIYTCKINDNEDALIDFMKYFLNRHKNEEDWLIDRMMDKIVLFYDLPYLSDKVWSALYDIVAMFYVKHGWATENILLGLIHFKLLHDKPIEETAEMLIETQINRTYINLSHMFKKDPCYKRQLLIVYIKLLEQKYNVGKWKANMNTLVYNIVQEMYELNAKCKKSRTVIEFMRINDYPWMQRTLYQDVIQTKHFYTENIGNLFREHEPELYNSWFHEKETCYIEYIRVSKAVNTLKRDRQSIMDHWKEYLQACKTYSHEKCVHRFVRATRWYKDLPIYFLEYCRDKWQQDKDINFLVVIALLLRGDAVAKLVEPLIPTETTLNLNDENARENYTVVRLLPLIMRLTNPPVPLEFVARLCEGDYLSVALMVLYNACQRAPLSRVISFAEKLSEKRVSVVKHGIRMMCLVSPIEEAENFLLSMWRTAKHHSIRSVLLVNAQELLFKNPCDHSWSLLRQMISTMTVEDDLLFSDLNSRRVPVEYTVEYVELLFNVIHKLLADGLQMKKVTKCITTMLNIIGEPTCESLSSDFIEKLLRQYLFHESNEISTVMITFTVRSLQLLKKNAQHKIHITKIFADVLKEKVNKDWDVPHPKKSNFYPVNYIVGCLINDIVMNSLVSNDPIEPPVFLEMMEIFFSMLTPQMDIRSHLLLLYAKELLNSDSPKEYGLNVGTIMPKLVESFSSTLMFLMSDVFNHLLSSDGRIKFRENFGKFEIMLDIVEGLLEANNKESHLMATFLLNKMPLKDHDTKYQGLYKKLLDMNNPVITCLLNNTKNQTSYDHVDFDVDN